MSYRLQYDETLSDGVRRVALEQLDDALELLADPHAGDVEEAVHEVRKSCKKVRGLVRLVRPAMGDVYQEANTTARDAARELSSIRDAHALLETFDDLVAAHAHELPPGGLDSVRRGLVERASEATAAVADDDERIERARELLTRLRSAVDRWPVDDDVDIIAGGVAKTYKRGRNRLADTLDDPTDEHLHEWRKRVKYSWYHARLLRNAAPSVLKPLAKRLHDLSDVLGDDHDLAVLRAQLQAEPGQFGGELPVRDALAIIDLQRRDLQERARRLGARLYVEDEDTFAERLAAYWSVWARHGDELDAGEIADLTDDGDRLDELDDDALRDVAQRLGVGGRDDKEHDELVADVRAAGGARMATG
jgi:CHAD domain-containing protein